MKFDLDYKIHLDDEVFDSQTWVANIEAQAEKIGDIGSLEGAIVLTVDSVKHCDELVEPILRFVAQWVRKLPWIITGDTETVAFRNSEHCVAFVPAGESVELSFFEGTESEIEEYVLEPCHIHLDAFANKSIGLAEKLLAMVEKVDPKMSEENEDCRDLRISLEEARNAWHDYQVHQRR